MARGQLEIAPSQHPHGGAFFTLPQQQLLSYYTSRDASPVGQLLSFTKQLMSEVDRVIVIGSAAMLAGPRAIMEACCQPYYNELSRAERGSRPRVSFAGDDLDNDRLQGLLHLLDAHRGKVARDVTDSWGLVVLAPSSEAPEVEFAARQLRSALEVSCGGDRALASRRLLRVEMDGAKAIPGAGCLLRVPQHVSEQYSVLSLAGLAPAAILGVNIMKLQEGALAASDQFIHEGARDSRALQVAAAGHLLAEAGLRRVIVPADRSLERTARWMTGLTMGLDSSSLVSRGVHDAVHWPQSTGTENGDGSPAASYVEMLATQRCRFDILPAGTSQEAAPMRRAQEAYFEKLAEVDCPSLVWKLPSTDEYSFGQLLQTQMLTAVVRAKLSGANPYAQKPLEQFLGKLQNIVGF
ncbi:MAG: glucose-6-phosphate isomerase [Aureliella sp.]